MKTVTEVSRITGISVRALHHYDRIGLLKPAQLTDAGYRLYDDSALRRLQAILLFRELQFPLREIKTILDSPAFDPAEALAQQIRLLEMERDRLDNVIARAREIQLKGAEIMNFDAFDRSSIDQYAEEAKARWGNTAAWAEYSRKPQTDMPRAGEALMDILADIAALRHFSPTAPEVAGTVDALQQHITANFYTCTDEILRSLGEMYVQDDRFRRNIDKRCGDGAAEFIRSAIRANR